MHSKFLSIMLMALVSVVACAARPSTITGEPITGDPITIMPNTTNIPKRISTYAMGCETKGNTKTCTSQDPDRLVTLDSFDKVNNHFVYNLPDWKGYTSYEFCFDSSSCGAMTTLSGSEFYPKNYAHVAIKAVEDLYYTYSCVKKDGGRYLYPTAVDIYYYDLNFVISWWFNDVYTYTCKYPTTN